jgi:hypothetical protein
MPARIPSKWLTCPYSPGYICQRIQSQLPIGLGLGQDMDAAPHSSSSSTQQWSVSVSSRFGSRRPDDPTYLLNIAQNNLRSVQLAICSLCNALLQLTYTHCPMTIVL